MITEELFLSDCHFFHLHLHHEKAPQSYVQPLTPNPLYEITYSIFFLFLRSVESGYFSRLSAPNMGRIDSMIRVHILTNLFQVFSSLTVFDALRFEVSFPSSSRVMGSECNISQISRINWWLPGIINGKVSLDRVDGEGP